jgi:hypothetical protein
VWWTTGTYLVDNDQRDTRIHCGAQSEKKHIGFGFFCFCRPASVACCRALSDGRFPSSGRGDEYLGSSVQLPYHRLILLAAGPCQTAWVTTVTTTRLRSASSLMTDVRPHSSVALEDLAFKLQRATRRRAQDQLDRTPVQGTYSAFDGFVPTRGQTPRMQLQWMPPPEPVVVSIAR